MEMSIKLRGYGTVPFSYVKPRCGKYEEYGISPGF